MPARLRLVLLAALLAACSPSMGTRATPAASDATSPSAAATERPSSIASPSQTVPASVAPTAMPDPAALDLEVTGCNGGVVLEWTPSRSPDFHHYIALRSPEAEIAPDYPPIAPAVDWGDTYATDPFVTSAADASILPSSTRWNYRVIAYDAAGRVVGSSPVRSARLSALDDMGTVVASTAADGRTTLHWQAFGGFSGCFTQYRVLGGVGRATTLLAVVSHQATTETTTDGLHPGTTYALRVEAVRVTTLGSFVVGETDVAFYTVPVAGG